MVEAEKACPEAWTSGATSCGAFEDSLDSGPFLSIRLTLSHLDGPVCYSFWSETLPRRSALELAGDVYEVAGGVAAAEQAGARNP